MQNVLGYAEADNAEVFPETTMPLISGLACKLYGETGMINFPENSLVRTVYGAASITEEYQCGFGVNPAYLSLFHGSDMQFTGFDNDGDPRVLEIRGNRFFVGTAFQPERSALKGETHPLIQRFIQSLV